LATHCEIHDPEIKDCPGKSRTDGHLSYAERCISYDRFCPTVCHTLVSCRNDSSYDHAVFTGGYPHDSIVSSWLTSPQNSKGNIGSEGAERERGSKNRQFLANKCCTKCVCRRSVFVACFPGVLLSSVL